MGPIGVDCEQGDQAASRGVRWPRKTRRKQ